MNLKAFNKLKQISAQFYQKEANSFNLSRYNAWPGFEKLLPYFNSNDNLMVLDLGSGNGRLYDFLNDKIHKFTYLGVEASAPLAKFSKGETLIEDLLQPNWELKLKNKTFNFITLLNVMHHIPSFKERLGLIKKAINFLCPNGYLVISFWDFLEPLNKKLSKLENTEAEIYDEHDYLMTWQKSEFKRYVHYANATEIKELEANLMELKLVESFYADGRNGKLNHYRIYQLKNKL